MTSPSTPQQRQALAELERLQAQEQSLFYPDLPKYAVVRETDQYMNEQTGEVSLITTTKRCSIVNYLMEMADFCHFPVETPLVAIRLLDRFLTTRECRTYYDAGGGGGGGGGGGSLSLIYWACMYMALHQVQKKQQQQENEQQASTTTTTASMTNIPLSTWVDVLAKGKFTTHEFHDMQERICTAVGGPHQLYVPTVWHWVTHVYVPLLPTKVWQATHDRLLLYAQREAQVLTSDVTLLHEKPSTLALQLVQGFLESRYSEPQSSAVLESLTQLVTTTTTTNTTTTHHGVVVPRRSSSDASTRISLNSQRGHRTSPRNSADSPPPPQRATRTRSSAGGASTTSMLLTRQGSSRSVRTGTRSSLEGSLRGTKSSHAASSLEAGSSSLRGTRTRNSHAAATSWEAGNSSLRGSRTTASPSSSHTANLDVGSSLRGSRTARPRTAAVLTRDDSTRSLRGSSQTNTSTTLASSSLDAGGGSKRGSRTNSSRRDLLTKQSSTSSLRGSSSRTSTSSLRTSSSSHAAGLLTRQKSTSSIGCWEFSDLNNDDDDTENENFDRALLPGNFQASKPNNNNNNNSLDLGMAEFKRMNSTEVARGEQERRLRQPRASRRPAALKAN